MSTTSITSATDTSALYSTTINPITGATVEYEAVAAAAETESEETESSIVTSDAANTLDTDTVLSQFIETADADQLKSVLSNVVETLDLDQLTSVASGLSATEASTTVDESATVAETKEATTDAADVAEVSTVETEESADDEAIATETAEAVAEEVKLAQTEDEAKAIINNYLATADLEELQDLAYEMMGVEIANEEEAVAETEAAEETVAVEATAAAEEVETAEAVTQVEEVAQAEEVSDDASETSAVTEEETTSESSREDWNTELMGYIGDEGYDLFMEATDYMSEAERYVKAYELDETASQLSDALNVDIPFVEFYDGSGSSTDLSNMLYENMLAIQDEENLSLLSEMATIQGMSLQDFLTEYGELGNDETETPPAISSSLNLIA